MLSFPRPAPSGKPQAAGDPFTPPPRQRRASAASASAGGARSPFTPSPASGSRSRRNGSRGRNQGSRRTPQSALRQRSSPAIGSGSAHGDARDESRSGATQRSRPADASRPAWDFTDTDMTRYQLAPEERLRRRLSRISKNRDEAASSLRDKFERMQEDIAPFVEVPAPREVWGHRRGVLEHMSPCFASRVPTGRAPTLAERKGQRQRPADVHAAKNFALAAPLGVSPSSAYTLAGGAAGVVREAHIADSEQRGARNPLEDALEAEIAQLLCAAGVPGDYAAAHDGGRYLNEPSTCCGAAGAPQYSFMRKVPSLSHRMEQDNLDSALEDIEDGADELEEQLSWWRRQQDSLLGFPRDSSSVPAGSSREGNINIETEIQAGEGTDGGGRHDMNSVKSGDEDSPLTAEAEAGELATESEWLQLPRVANEASTALHCPVAASQQPSLATSSATAVPQSDSLQLVRDGARLDVVGSGALAALVGAQVFEFTASENVPCKPEVPSVRLHQFSQILSATSCGDTSSVVGLQDSGIKQECLEPFDVPPRSDAEQQSTAQIPRGGGSHDGRGGLVDARTPRYVQSAESLPARSARAQTVRVTDSASASVSSGVTAALEAARAWAEDLAASTCDTPVAQNHPQEERVIRHEYVNGAQGQGRQDFGPGRSQDQLQAQGQAGGQSQEQALDLNAGHILDAVAGYADGQGGGQGQFQRQARRGRQAGPGGSPSAAARGRRPSGSPARRVQSVAAGVQVAAAASMPSSLPAVPPLPSQHWRRPIEVRSFSDLFNI